MKNNIKLSINGQFTCLWILGLLTVTVFGGNLAKNGVSEKLISILIRRNTIGT